MRYQPPSPHLVGLALSVLALHACGGIDLSGLEDGQLSYQRVGSVSGVVLDAFSSQPVMGASVRISQQEDVTDPAGGFSVSALQAGQHALTILASGYLPFNTTVAVEPGANSTGTLLLQPVVCPPSPCGSEGSSECTAGQLRACALDDNGCLAWGEWLACSSGTCEDNMSCGGCNNGCSPSGASACAAGSISVCAPDTSGCLAWQAGTLCESTWCVDAATCAPTPPDIDVCLRATPDATIDTCYQAVRGASCPSEPCALPELNLDLGTVATGSLVSATVRVRNTGDATLQLDTPAWQAGSSSRFGIAPPGGTGTYVSVERGEQISFAITLDASQSGAHDGRLLLGSNDAQLLPGAPVDPGTPDSPVVINLSAEVASADVGLCPLTPTLLNFGSVAVSSSATATFSFINCGDVDVTLFELSIVDGGTGAYTIDSSLPATGGVLAPDETGSVTVRYTPIGAQTDTAELRITSDPTGSSPHLGVALTGQGMPLAGCEIAWVPSALAFGYVQTSASRDVTVVNTGGLDCVLTSISRVSGTSDIAITAGVPTPSVVLEPMEAHDVTVTYTPSDTTPEIATFEATASDIGDNSSTQQLTVSGTGELPPSGCVLEISPIEINFGDVSLGGVADALLDVTNVGTGMSFCQISSVTVTQGAPHFAAGDLSLLSSLIPVGASRSVRVSFAPQTHGALIGSLIIASDDVTASERQVVLRGGGLAPTLCVSDTGAIPASTPCGSDQLCGTVDFGAASSEITRTLGLTNCGDGVLRLRGLSVESPNAAFVLETPLASSPPTELGAGVSTAVIVRYRPGTGGDAGILNILSTVPGVEHAKVNLVANTACAGLLRCNAELGFGTVEVDRTAVRNVHCINAGNTPVVVTDVSLSGSGALRLDSSTSAILPAAETLVAQVSCTPSAAGSANGTLTVSSSACDSAAVQVNVLCNGTQPAAPACIGSNTYTPEELWQWTGSPSYPGYDDVWSTPLVLNLTDDNGDGAVDTLDSPDVVFTAFQSQQAGTDCSANDPAPAVLVAVSGDSGAELWTWGVLPVSDPGDPNASVLEAEGQLAAADIDADGLPEILGLKYTFATILPGCNPSDLSCCFEGKYVRGALYALEHDGTFKWESERFHFPTRWAESGSAPAVGDMNGDGLVEIAVGNAVFDRHGALIFEGETGTHGEGGTQHGAFSVFADLDGDGDQELVAGRTAFDANGAIVYHRDDLSDGIPAVANLDADAQLEIILSTGDNTVVVLEHDGTTKYGPVGVPDSAGEGYIATAPAVGDLDGDGLAEIVVPASDRLYVLEADLTEKWHTPISDATGMASPAIFDFEGDGRDEVVFADEAELTIFDGLDALPKMQAPRSSRTIAESPVIADIDNDGRAEILVAEESSSGTAGAFGMTAYSSVANDWVGAPRIWNQHAFVPENVSETSVLPVSTTASVRHHYRGTAPRCE